METPRRMERNRRRLEFERLCKIPIDFVMKFLANTLVLHPGSWPWALFALVLD